MTDSVIRIVALPGHGDGDNDNDDNDNDSDDLPVVMPPVSLSATQE